MLHSKGVTKNTTNYGVQGPNLGQYGADTQYASPVVGQEEGIPIGGTGAGFLPSQQELRRLSEQNEKRARNQQMVQELQKILGGIQTPANYGLNAGSGNVMFPGSGSYFGGTGGDIGGNRDMARGFFGGQTGNPLAMEAPGGFSSLDGVLNSAIAGMSFGNQLGVGGSDMASFGRGSLGSAGFNFGLA